MQKICPERLNWPVRLAGISEGARWISKKKSRPFFIIIFQLKNGNFKTRDFSPLRKRVLAGVTRKFIKSTWLRSEMGIKKLRTRDPVNKIKVERDYKRGGGSFQQK